MKYAPEQYLQSIFNKLYIGGRINKALLSAIINILENIVESPLEKLNEWEEGAKEMVRKELEVEDVNFLSIPHEYEKGGDLNAAFELLWHFATGLKDPQLMASTRLIMIAIIGEERQKELIAEWTTIPEKPKAQINENVKKTKRTKLDAVRKNIADGKIEEAFKIILNHEKDNGNDNQQLVNDITLLQFQYSQFQREVILGIGEPKTEINKIVNAILSITSKIENDD